MPGPVLDALLWAWTNANGRLPDRNTMSEEEIYKYWNDYRAILSSAILDMTGKEPDEYLSAVSNGER
jgi:hypothetical protein